MTTTTSGKVLGMDKVIVNTKSNRYTILSKINYDTLKLSTDGNLPRKMDSFELPDMLDKPDSILLDYSVSTNVDKIFIRKGKHLAIAQINRNDTLALELKDIE